MDRAGAASSQGHPHTDALDEGRTGSLLQPPTSHLVPTAPAFQTFTELLGADPAPDCSVGRETVQQAGPLTSRADVIPSGPHAALSIPEGLLFDVSQPGQASQHRIFTLGPITLDHDEFAASLSAQHTGVEIPESQQTKLFIEPISFTETFFGGYPRLCETARRPGVRHKTVRISVC